MNQQINLYRPIFRKQEKKFSTLAMLQAGGAVVAGVVVLYAFVLWQVSGARSELQQAEKQYTSAAKRLDDVAQKFGPGAKIKPLEDEVTKLERQVATRLQVRELLSRGLFSNTAGFSEFFVAFARQHLPGIWLTGFDITGAGESMRLQGRTIDPAQVPRYVQRLAAERPLAGKEFQVFTMSRPDKKEGEAQPYVEFLFRTALAKDQERRP